MTSLDDIDFDDFQELSVDQENLLKELKPVVQTVAIRSSWGPIIVTTLIMILIVILNSEWITSKLENVTYYKYSLAGILFSSVLFSLLFLL